MLPPGMLLMPDGSGMPTSAQDVVVPTMPQNGDQNLQDDLAVSDDSEEENDDEDSASRHQQELEQQPPPPPPDGDDVMAF